MFRSLALALLLAAGPAFAQTSLAQVTSAAQPTPGVAAKARPVPAASTSSSVIAEKARRESEAREKRWDDRMKRVTRSMCTGC